MDRPRVRVFLAGRVCIQSDAVRVDEDRFPGRQGRLAFALLAAEHGRAVSRERLAEALWPDGPPQAWDTALRAIVSKLRRVLSDAGLPGGDTLRSAFGCYELTLPPDAWLDLEAAADAIHRAETSLRAEDPQDALGWTLVAISIAKRPFLPGEEGPWLEERRATLRHVLLRALECRSQVLTSTGAPVAAIRDAEEALSIDPFRETTYRHLMRAFAAAGDRAGALRAYERCRSLLADELGADPSTDTEAVYLEILRSA